MSEVERADLLEALAKHRELFLVPVGAVDDETAKHAGHADIVRESYDGQKSMG